MKHDADYDLAAPSLLELSISPLQLPFAKAVLPCDQAMHCGITCIPAAIPMQFLLSDTESHENVAVIPGSSVRHLKDPVLIAVLDKVPVVHPVLLTADSRLLI